MKGEIRPTLMIVESRTWPTLPWQQQAAQAPFRAQPPRIIARKVCEHQPKRTDKCRHYHYPSAITTFLGVGCSIAAALEPDVQHGPAISIHLHRCQPRQVKIGAILSDEFAYQK